MNNGPVNFVVHVLIIGGFRAIVSIVGGGCSAVYRFVTRPFRRAVK